MTLNQEITTNYDKLIWSDNDQKAQTPSEVWDCLHKEFGKQLFDPCPLNPKWDGLNIPWKKLNYVNPPYNKCKEWMKKAVHEMKVNKCKSICLIPCRSHTNWFHEFVLPHAAEIRLIKNGVRFVGYKRKSPFSTCIVIFDPNHEGTMPKLNSVNFYGNNTNTVHLRLKSRKRKKEEEENNNGTQNHTITIKIKLVST